MLALRRAERQIRLDREVSSLMLPDWIIRLNAPIISFVSLLFSIKSIDLPLNSNAFLPLSKDNIWCLSMSAQRETINPP